MYDLIYRCIKGWCRIMQSNVKRFGRKFLSLLLSASVISQLAVIPVYAAQTGATEIYFDDAVITERDAEQNLFLFGSKNMTVSEKSKDRYIMKIVRTGDASVPAEVDLKFTDVSADYGKNYEIYLAEDGTKPTEEPGRTSMVDFFLHNADSQEEIPAVSGEDILDLVTENGGFDTVDASGNTLSSVSFSAEETEDALDLGQLSERQMITDADSEAIGDAFPGTYFHLSFAAGETEKDIVVLPKYSRAADGDCLVSMTLKNPSEGFALPEDAFSAYLTIRDENDAAPAVLSFEKAEYSADGDSVSVTVTRSGRINEIVSANLCTVSDTAEIGTDFQGIDAALYFPMGIKSRTVDILVNHTSEDETLTFDAKLVNPVNCEIEDGVARVSIAPEETAVLAAETAQETAAAASAPTVDGTSAGSADEEKALLSAPEEEATLMADATNSAYDSYLSAALLPSEFTCFGNAWNSDSGNFH